MTYGIEKPFPMMRKWTLMGYSLPEPWAWTPQIPDCGEVSVASLLPHLWYFVAKQSLNNVSARGGSKYSPIEKVSSFHACCPRVFTIFWVSVPLNRRPRCHRWSVRLTQHLPAQARLLVTLIASKSLLKYMTLKRILGPCLILILWGKKSPSLSFYLRLNYFF